LAGVRCVRTYCNRLAVAVVFAEKAKSAPEPTRQIQERQTMSDLGVQPAANVTPGLSQWQRVMNTFTAPSKTFEDIKLGHKSWWMPFILMTVLTYIFFFAITSKISWATVADNMVRMNPKAEERISQLTPEQRDMQMKGMRYGTEGVFAGSPILFGLGFTALVSAALLGTINFGFGGRATFGGVFAVCMYAFLPWLVRTVLGTIVLYSGMAPESFNLNTPAPTSVGSFLSPQDTNLALYTFATWLDFTTIWCIVLLGIGLATVAGVKRSSGYIAAFGWWALLLIINVGYVAATS